MVIRISDNEYRLKYTIRGLFVYEQITGTTFNPDKLLNEYTLLFAFLIANNEDFRLSFNELIDRCDEAPEIFLTFRKWLIEELKVKARLAMPENETEPDVKKN